MRLQGRILGTTPVDALRAARLERATRRYGVQVWRSTTDLHQRRPLRTEHRRDRVEKAGGVRVLWLSVEVTGRAGLDHSAGIHHEHPFGDPRHDAEIVSDPDQRHPELAPQLVDQAEHLLLDRDVERGRRLVGDQHLRPHRHGHRDHHALSLPAGQLVRV